MLTDSQTDRQTDWQTDRHLSLLLKLCNFKEVSRAKNDFWYHDNGDNHVHIKRYYYTAMLVSLLKGMMMRQSVGGEAEPVADQLIDRPAHLKELQLPKKCCGWGGNKWSQWKKGGHSFKNSWKFGENRYPQNFKESERAYPGLDVYQIWNKSDGYLWRRRGFSEMLTDRQSDSQTDRQTVRQSDSQTDRHFLPLLKLCNFKEISRAKKVAQGPFSIGIYAQP